MSLAKRNVDPSLLTVAPDDIYIPTLPSKAELRMLAKANYLALQMDAKEKMRERAQDKVGELHENGRIVNAQAAAQVEGLQASFKGEVAEWVEAYNRRDMAELANDLQHINRDGANEQNALAGVSLDDTQPVSSLRRLLGG